MSISVVRLFAVIVVLSDTVGHGDETNSTSSVQAKTVAARIETSPRAPLDIPADWVPTTQSQLQQQLESALPLDVQQLGTAVYGIDPCGYCLVPNPDRRTFDVLLWYRKAYRESTRVYIVDLGSGQIRKQEFKDEEDRARVEMAFNWFGSYGLDGKLYGAITDQHTWGSGGIMRTYRYDPATNKIELFKLIEGHGGERNPTVLSPNGWIYGAGTWLGEGDTFHRGSAYGFNPETGEVRNYGPVGPKIKGTAFGYTIGACDTHVYVAVGKIPWYLVAIHIDTGKQSVLLEAPEGGFGLHIVRSPETSFGGAVCYTQQTSDEATRKYYWLYHGKAIEKKLPGAGHDPSCPWPDEVRSESPLGKWPPAPEIYSGQLYPDENDQAVLWFQPPDDGDRETSQKWRKVTLNGVVKHPLAIHRLHALPDGRLFGSAAGAKGRFLFDPETQKVSYLGDGGASLYALTHRGDRLYWSGYSLAPIFQFDPDRPWTLEKGGPPGTPIINSSSPRISSLDANPRKVHADRDAVFDLTRVKKMLSATTAADGRVYFGGKGQRDYQGGGLAWYDPDSGQLGGIWEPFAGQDIGWVTTAIEGRYVVIGTEGGKAYIYDTQKQTLLADNTFTPVPGSDKSGPLVEVAPGRMLGITWEGRNRYRGVIYGVEIPSGRVLFNKSIPWGVPFNWGQGTGKWDYQLGPDGFVWTTLAKAPGQAVLARIDPRDANVEVIGSIKPAGKMAFVGRDLYLTGTEQIRRLVNIVP